MIVRGAFLLSMILLMLAGPADAAPDEPSPAPPAEAIDRAIEQGSDWLLDEQRPTGTWGTPKRAVGHTALVAFALLHSGIEEDGEDRGARSLARALKYLDRAGPGVTTAGDRGAQVYDLALLVLVERARGRAAGPRIRRLVGLLERAQAGNGQWSYELPRGSKHAQSAGDNSNTQFAVLALGAAVGEGVRVKSESLRRARSWWQSAVQDDGGFGYSSGGSLASATTGSMTAAGISSLAILEATLGGTATHGADEGGTTSRLLDRAIERLERGFALDHNFGPAPGTARQRQRNAGRGWLHYYLWSVERAMVLAGRERIDGRDWYAEGAAHLLSTQKKDGSWRGEHPLYATCFALLFLTRAADPPRVFTPPDRPAGTLTPGEETPRPPPPPDHPVGDVDDWLTNGLSPDALRRACLTQGPSSLEPLVKALGHPKPKVRRRANEALRALLGDERVGRADRHPLARGRLRLWVRRNERHLRERDGRFVATR